MGSITHKGFGAKTGGLEVAAAFSEEIRGKVVLITGVSPLSIGASLAIAIASQQPSLLILASRTQSKIRTLTEIIETSYPGVRIREVLLDLSSQVSVRRAAKEIERIVNAEADGRGIDVVFNNAGVNISPRILSPDGIELQFATNHIGPFLLTCLLLPLILPPPLSSSSRSRPHSGSRKRIINTSSEAHRISPVRFSDINQTPGQVVDEQDQPRRGMPSGILRNDGGYEPAVAYGMSKTANVLMCVGLNERLEGRVKSLAVMPGTIMTELVRGMDEDYLKGVLEGTPESEWKTPDQGAATLIVAGFDPGLDGEKGVYLEDCQMKRPSKWATDPAKAQRLWKLSEELVGQEFAFVDGGKKEEAIKDEDLSRKGSKL